MVIAGMKQVMATDESGARLSPKQLADAGIKPDERVVGEIRPHTRRHFERDDDGRVPRPRRSSSIRSRSTAGCLTASSTPSTDVRTAGGVPARVRRPSGEAIQRRR
jgi:hypothetical protein